MSQEKNMQSCGATLGIIKELYRWMKFQHIRLYHKSKCRFSRLEITEENLWCIDLRHVTEGYTIHMKDTLMDTAKNSQSVSSSISILVTGRVGPKPESGLPPENSPRPYPCTLILTEFATMWSADGMWWKEGFKITQSRWMDRGR